LGRVHDLENKVRELEGRASEKARYELVEDYRGAITYRVKEVARNGEPVHYLCPGCLDNQAVKSILQFNSRNKVIGTCHACGKAYRFRETPSVPTRRHERI